MAVCLLNVFLFKEGCCRQNNISVVSGIGEELVVHHSEEICTHEASHNIVVIGRDGCRIRVVDEYSFYGWVVDRGEGLP